MSRRGPLLGALLAAAALAVPALTTGGPAAPAPGASARARVVALGAQVGTLERRLAPCASAAAARRRASAARAAALRNLPRATPAAARARAAALSRALGALLAARGRCTTAARGGTTPSGPEVMGPGPVPTPPASGPGAGPAPAIGLPFPPPGAGAPPPLGAPAPSPAPAPGTPGLEIDADPTGALRFVQSSLTAAPGALTLTLVNAGPGLHTLAIKGNGVAAGPTANVASGGSATLAVDLPPGTYTFYCTRPGHEAAGMTGTLTIG